jgi:hypothetical protein
MSDEQSSETNPPCTLNRKSNRDQFKTKIKENLAKRVSYLCSNPNCRCTTIGPKSSPESTVNTGVAAHITAASPGGPRYDARMTTAQRTDITNGIWLCETCAKLIDADVLEFTVEVLNGWKAEAEKHAGNLVQQRMHKGWARVLPEELKPLVSLELTTPPPITQNIARSPEGQCWLVYWDSQNATYRWEMVTEEYAVERLRPVCVYRQIIDWRDLFKVIQ